jgi:hypothetical protein
MINSSTLSGLACAIGPGVSDFSFAIDLPYQTLTAQDFDLSVETGPDGLVRFFGSCGTHNISWLFTPEGEVCRVSLSVTGDLPFICSRIDSLILTYAPGGSLASWRVPTLGESVESVGMPRVAQLAETLGDHPIQGKPGSSKFGSGSLMRGAFPDSRLPGLFLGTILPQNNRHFYAVEPSGPEALRFTASTFFQTTSGDNPLPNQYTSESTWFSAAFPIGKVIEAYASHLAPLSCGQEKAVLGWNSWDYYFSALKLEDILENADFIRADEQLGRVVRYIVADMGWEHCWGEWQPNYRFPGGLERLASEIGARGFIPGIWTAPLIVHPLSYPGLRQGEMFIKNEFGDPWASPEGGQYAVDPTHPAGQAFLREIFTRLHKAGFRLFKIDFVNALVEAPRFYDPSKGPYGALADFFHLVRECVGPESHILGCSLPEECGPGLADSHRTGIDIHNQWTHVEWAVDFYQFAFWHGARISTNDPDFLVVRGRDTSLEVETNVLNPNAHNPNPPRWRRGTVFTLDEARTWATFVSLAGGSVFLSDRMTMLNEAGLELARKVIDDAAVARKNIGATPLDLADDERPSLWFSALEDENRLGMINWSDSSIARWFNFAEWGLPGPQAVTDFWTDETIPVIAGVLTVQLDPHASLYVRW